MSHHSQHLLVDIDRALDDRYVQLRVRHEGGARQLQDTLRLRPQEMQAGVRH